MVFQPRAGDALVIGGTNYLVSEHPAAPGMAYGQEGRQAVVYALQSADERVALKVFKPRFRLPSLVGLSRKIEPLAQLPGLRVCQRTLLTPQQHSSLLLQYPDLTYAVLMPWIEGPTWLEVLLDGRALTPSESGRLALALAETLSRMEQEGLAHCDLSAPNLLLPALAGGSHRPADGVGFMDHRRSFLKSQSSIELVDVEQMYGPDLSRPELVPSGSLGYAHNTAVEGTWSAHADRFAGALLLAEILGWCDPQVREAVWGESYFDPAELQQESERYRVLSGKLAEHWGERVAQLLQRCWQSSVLPECPTFGEWVVALSALAPVASVEDMVGAADGGVSPAVRALLATALRLEEQGNPLAAVDAYRRAIPLVPPSSTLAGELQLILRDLEGRAGASSYAPTVVVPVQMPTQAPSLDVREHGAGGTAVVFAEGTQAYQQGDWARARELLGAVAVNASPYSGEGQIAARLLADMERRTAPVRPGSPLPWVLAGVALVLLLAVPLFFLFFAKSSDPGGPPNSFSGPVFQRATPTVAPPAPAAEAATSTSLPHVAPSPTSPPPTPVPLVTPTRVVAPTDTVQAPPTATVVPPPPTPYVPPQAPTIRPVQPQLGPGAHALVVGVPLNDPLSLRDRPGTGPGSQILVQAALGQLVTVVGRPQADPGVNRVCRSQWWQIHWTVTGWSNDGGADGYLLPSARGAGLAVGQYAVVAVTPVPGDDYLALLDIPQGQTGNEVGRLKPGHSYPLIEGPQTANDGLGGRWWRLQVEETGWSCGDYLQVVGSGERTNGSSGDSVAVPADAPAPGTAGATEVEMSPRSSTFSTRTISSMDSWGQ